MRNFVIVFRLLAIVLCCGMTTTMAQNNFGVRYDTILLDVKPFALPTARISLCDVAEQDGQLFCHYEQNRYYGYGFNAGLFCSINPQTKHFSWQKIEDPYSRDGIFLLSKGGVVYCNSGVSATYDDGSWHFLQRDKSHSHELKTIYDDDHYTLVQLDYGEWGGYTWVTYKPTGKTLLYPKPFDQIICISDTLYLSYDGIYRLEPGLIAKAEESADTPQRVMEMGPDKFVMLANYGRVQYTKDLNCLWPTQKQSRPYEHSCLSGHEIPDTLVYSLFSHQGKPAMLLKLKGEIFVATIEGGSVKKELKLLPGNVHLHAKQCNMKGHALAHYQSSNNEHTIINIHDNDIHFLTLIHNQDSLPFLSSDHFETSLNYYRLNGKTVTMADIHQHEISVGGISSDTCWRQSGNNYIRHYYKNLSNRLCMSTQYLLDSTGHLSQICWQWSPAQTYNPSRPVSDSGAAAVNKKKQIKQFLLQTLGSCSMGERDATWSLPEGDFSYWQKIHHRLFFDIRY